MFHFIIATFLILAGLLLYVVGPARLLSFPFESMYGSSFASWVQLIQGIIVIWMMIIKKPMLGWIFAGLVTLCIVASCFNDLGHAGRGLLGLAMVEIPIILAYWIIVTELNRPTN